MVAVAPPSPGTLRRKDQLTLDAIQRVVPEVMRQRGLDPDRIVKFIFVPGSVRWCVVVLDRLRLGRIAQYAHPDVAHQIQTALGGMPTAVVNNRGLGYAIQLDAPRALPDQIPFNPDWWQPGLLRLGMLPGGAEVKLRWSDLLSLLVAGLPSKGKSSLIRTIAYHALREGCQIVCIDKLNNTLPMLARYPGVMLSTDGEADARRALDGVSNEIKQRVALFSTLHAQDQYPDNLAAYNALVAPEARLPEILLIIEEYNHLLNSAGGPNGPTARVLKDILEVGRKYGIKVLIAAQSVTVEEIGFAKKLVGLVACFNLGPSGAAVSRTVFGRADTSNFPPGRCLFTGVGEMQSYWLPPEVLIQMKTSRQGPRMSALHLRLATFAHKHHGGKLTNEVAQAFMAAEPAAPGAAHGQKWMREQLNDMEARGWLVRSRADKNARLLSETARQEVEAALTRELGPRPAPPNTSTLPGRPN